MSPARYLPESCFLHKASVAQSLGSANTPTSFRKHRCQKGQRPAPPLTFLQNMVTVGSAGGGLDALRYHHLARQRFFVDERLALRLVHSCTVPPRASPHHSALILIQPKRKRAATYSRGCHRDAGGRTPVLEQNTLQSHVAS